MAKIRVSKRHLRFSLLLGTIITLLIVSLRGTTTTSSKNPKELPLKDNAKTSSSGGGLIPSFSNGFNFLGSNDDDDATNGDKSAILPEYDFFGNTIDYSQYIPQGGNYSNMTVSDFSEEELLSFKKEYDDEILSQKEARRLSWREKFIKDKTKGYGGPDTLESNMVVSWANKGEKPKACLLAVVEDDDMEGILKSINEMEDKFNRKFNYPWVFLTREGLNEEFQRALNETLRVDYKIAFIPDEYWEYPDFVDQDKACLLYTSRCV